jgi:hypothetical protein
MESKMLESFAATEPPAVLFLVFNRPDTTRRVFEQIRRARPPRLYVAADGPRPARAGEVALCERVRAIATGVDWPCQVHTLFRDENLGCRVAVSAAIGWFFEHEEEGIILEDDCLPAPDFFRYCAFALARWRHEPEVMHVGGTVYVDYTAGTESVVFSKLVPITGWATWRRAWRLYDPSMARINELGRLPLRQWYRSQAGNVRRAIRQIHERQINAWGARWVLTVLVNGGHTVLPRANLISNIGYEATGTNTTFDSHLANLPLGGLPVHLTAPHTIASFPLHDEALLRVLNRRTQLLRRAWRRLQQVLSDLRSRTALSSR